MAKFQSGTSGRLALARGGCVALVVAASASLSVFLSGCMNAGELTLKALSDSAVSGGASQLILFSGTARVDGTTEGGSLAEQTSAQGSFKLSGVAVGGWYRRTAATSPNTTPSGLGLQGGLHDPQR